MFKKIFDTSFQKKSIFSNNQTSYFLGLDSVFGFAENANKFMEYYFKSSPVFTATKIIADSASSIPTVIFDKENDKRRNSIRL